MLLIAKNRRLLRKRLRSLRLAQEYVHLSNPRDFCISTRISAAQVKTKSGDKTKTLADAAKKIGQKKRAAAADKVCISLTKLRLRSAVLASH